MKYCLPVLGLIAIVTCSFRQEERSSSSMLTNDYSLLQAPPDSATIYVSFTVETSGKISNVQVVKIKCRKCSRAFKENLKAEAIRIIRSTPDREPTNERRHYIQPIKLKLDEE